jgi:hypothetical protein
VLVSRVVILSERSGANDPGKPRRSASEVLRFARDDRREIEIRPAPDGGVDAWR